MHSWNWDTTCRPKREGVLVSEVADIVNVAGIRLVWRLCNNYRSRWMREKYLKRQHISIAHCSLLDSGTWKWIVYSKDKALQCMTKKISNGLTHSSGMIPGCQGVSSGNRWTLHQLELFTS